MEKMKATASATMADRIANLRKLLTDLGKEQLEVIIKILSIYATGTTPAATAEDVAIALINEIDKRSNKIYIYLRVISWVLDLSLDSNEEVLRNAAIRKNLIKPDECCIEDPNDSVHSRGCNGCIDLILDRLNIEKDMVMILFWATKRSEANDEELAEAVANGGQEVRPTQFISLVSKMRQLVKTRKEENAAKEGPDLAEEAAKKAAPTVVNNFENAAEEARTKGDNERARKLMEAAKEARKLMEAAKAGLINYVETNEGATFDESNQEYHKKRVTHLDAVSAVNQLRAKKTHDETKGLHVFGVTVPFSNLVRDGLLIFIALISLKLTPMYKTMKDDHGHEVAAEGEEETNVRAANGFTWEPILEVAKLFIAIFICMIPALKILQAGVNGGLSSVVLAVQSSTNDPVNMMYFWLTGILSSFLDNAPTYVVFFNTAGGDPTSLMGEGGMFDLSIGTTLLAISCGAVFMGANTYIGNAPNFMVKAIAEENGVKMPSFFGYMIWSVAILIPTFIIVALIYFRS